MAKKQKTFEGNRMKFYLDDFRNVMPLKNIQTVIVDPPYNINFNYGKNFKDNIDPEEYKQLMYDVADLSYKSTKKDSSMFIINYPQIIAELFQTLKETEWNIHQWISWVYPSNIGHSKSKFTRAHRSILWLVKDNPKVNIDSVTQPYKNPTDRRVRELIKSGKKGTNLYDWWEINLVKNVSKDKKQYVNQIPSEVLKRLILTTTDTKDKVLDPMCGTGSTAIEAAKLKRSGIGIDLNPYLTKIWNDELNENK